MQRPAAAAAAFLRPTAGLWVPLGCGSAKTAPPPPAHPPPPPHPPPSTPSSPLHPILLPAPIIVHNAMDIFLALFRLCIFTLAVVSSHVECSRAKMRSVLHPSGGPPRRTRARTHASPAVAGGIDFSALPALSCLWSEHLPCPDLGPPATYPSQTRMMACLSQMRLDSEGNRASFYLPWPRRSCTEGPRGCESGRHGRPRQGSGPGPSESAMRPDGYGLSPP